ncbi:hypothetical protein V6N13_065795 [Hibiscus sabdariffa]
MSSPKNGKSGGRLCTTPHVSVIGEFVDSSFTAFLHVEYASPNATYGQAFPTEEDFAKEPAVVPSQLHLTKMKHQHVVLNHLFIEKGWASQSVVALGLTHRFESKYKR